MTIREETQNDAPESIVKASEAQKGGMAIKRHQDTRGQETMEIAWLS